MDNKKIAVLTALISCASCNRARAETNSALGCLQASAQSGGLSGCLNESGKGDSAAVSAAGMAPTGTAPALPAAAASATDGLGARIEAAAGRVSPGVVAVMTGGPRKINGSGFVVENGPSGLFILTNKHVVNNEDTVWIQFESKQLLIHKGAVVGTADQATDLALIHVDPGQLGQENLVRGVPTLELGDSERLTVGQPLLMLGHPLGVPETVLTLSRLTGKGYVTGMPVLVFDGHLSPGNSGGPLVDLDGTVVGVNTAVLPLPAQGVAFAVPMGPIRSVVLPQLRFARGDKKDRMRYGVLGVELQPVTPEIMGFLGLPRRDSAIVTKVRSDEAGFFDGAGLRRGDVVVGIEGEDLEYSGIGAHTLLSPWDQKDPKNPRNALVYRVIPEAKVRQGLAEDPGSVWRMAFLPDRRNRRELFSGDGATPAEPELTGENATAWRLSMGQAKEGVWLHRDMGGRDIQDQTFIREIAVRGPDAALSFRSVATLADIRAIAEKGHAEVLLIVSRDLVYTPHSGVHYVLVAGAP